MLPYNSGMNASESSFTDHERFRTAYWQAVHDFEAVRLRQWEQWHVTLPQLRVLSQVRRMPGITTGDLAELLGITVSTTSGLVSKLADRGLIERTSAPGDRRQIPLRISPEGEALVGELRGPSAAFLEEVIARLGDDLATVAQGLERLAQATAAAREALPPVKEAHAAEVGA